MRKFILNQPLVTTSIVFSVCVICLFVINACRKMEHQNNSEDDVSNIRSKFFNVPIATNPIVKTIAQSIKRQDQQHDFVPALSRKAGYPKWDKALIAKPSPGNTNSRLSSDSGEVVLIPFIKDHGYVTNAILLCKIEGERDTTYDLIYAARYKEFGFNLSDSTKTSARNIFHLFTVFDNEIFGYTDFNVNDKRILSGSQADSTEQTRVTLVDGHGTSYTNRMSSITYCNTYEVCRLCGFRESGRYTDGCRCGSDLYTYCTTVWIETWENGGGGGINNGNTGGGGGGGGWYNENPCRAIPDSTNPCTQGGGGGWGPVTGNQYTPYLYDSVGVTDILRDSFPCTYAFLKDSLQDANLLAQLAGANVFHDSSHMHLTFDTSMVYTQQGQPSAETVTTVSPFIDDADGVTTFSAVIHLNPWHLRHATKEKMISTIIHESMHAIFRLRWGQYIRWRDYGQGSIDSNWMKAHYPSHWYYMTGQTRPLSELQDHEIMATDYMNMYKNIMQQFWNPGASSAVRDSVMTAMLFGGLRETTVWKNLPSYSIDTCKYKAIQLSAERSFTGTYGVPGCGNYNYHYSDSLKLRPSCN